MPLCIVYGPTGSGKTTHAIDAFVKALDQRNAPVYIAPSEPDARHFERQILARRDPVFGGKVTTFGGLCREILSARDPGLTVLDAGGRLMLIRAVVDAAGGLRILENSSGFDGFVSAIAELFSEFALLGIEPRHMQQTLTPWSKSNKWRQDLTRDLFCLYQEYRTALAEMSACDEEIAQRLALQHLRSNQDIFSTSPIIIDGFWDFTPLQHEFIQVMAKSGELVVTLPYEQEKTAYEATRHHLDLLAVGEALLKRLPAQNSEDRTPALRHVVSNLFEEAYPRASAEVAGEDIIMVRGAGLRGQAELIAAEILELWRAGQSLDKIAVICRNIDRDLIAVAAALKDFGVPYELPAPVPLSRTPVGMAALAALEFATGDQSRDSLLSFLRSDLSGEAPETVDHFDRHIRLRGLSERDELLSAWKRFSGRPLDGLSNLAKAAAVGPETLSAELCNLMGGLVCSGISSTGNTLDHVSLDLLAFKSLKSVCRESVRAAGVVTEAGGEAGDGTKDSLTSSQSAGRMFRRGMQTASIRLPAAQHRGCVRLLDPHRVLNQRFDILFVCGLLEKQFPSLGREDPFFSDQDRRELKGYGLALDPHERRLDEERFLFHRTVSRARKKLYLCHPYCDKEGKPTIRSLFVEDLLDLFVDGLFEQGSDHLMRHRKIGDVTFPVAQAPTADQALRSLALESSSGGSKSALAAARPAGLQDRLRSCLIAARPAPPLLTDGRILSMLREQNDFVITALQRYLGCPFRYFVETLLAPTDMDPPAHGLRRGQAVHRILCQFGELLRGLKLALPEADDDQLAEARRQMAVFIEAEFAEAGSDLETVILKTELGFHLDRFIDRERDSRRRFRVYDVEVGFGGRKQKDCGGKESTDDMLNLSGVRLRGRIDRIDWAGDRDLAIIVDYKSSRDVTSQRHFEQNKEIQVPLYMLALSIFGLRPIAGEYYAIRGEKRGGLYLANHADALGAASGQISSSDFVDAAVFNERLEKAQEHAMEAVEGIRSGRFPAEPLAGACRYCGLDGICRREESQAHASVEDPGNND